MDQSQAAQMQSDGQFHAEDAREGTQGKRKSFTSEEDIRLLQIVSKFGANSWRSIAKYMPGRTDRQCRERYRAYLDPRIRRDPWTSEEDELLRQKFQLYGSNWSTIASFFKGRSYNSVKNRWYKHIIVHKQEKAEATFDSSIDSSIFGDMKPMLFSSIFAISPDEL